MLTNQSLTARLDGLTNATKGKFFDELLDAHDEPRPAATEVVAQLRRLGRSAANRGHRPRQAASLCAPSGRRSETPPIDPKDRCPLLARQPQRSVRLMHPKHALSRRPCAAA